MESKLSAKSMVVPVFEHALVDLARNSDEPTDAMPDPLFINLTIIPVKAVIIG